MTPFFPTRESVYGSYIYDQVNAIRRNSDYEALVFRPSPGRGKISYYEYGGVKVHMFPSRFMPSYFFNGVTNKYNGHAFLAALREAGINLDDIAVVHGHTASYACYCTAIKKLKPSVNTVLQYHDPDPYQVRCGKLATWKPNALFRAKQLIGQLSYIDLHLCISEKVRYNLQHFPTPHPQECYQPYIDILHVLRRVKTRNDLNAYVLYNGVDTSQFHSIHGIKDNSVFQIGCVANYIDWKSHITLLKAVDKIHGEGLMPDMKLKLIGHGPLEEDLRKYVSDHKLDEVVSFEKEVDHAELPQFYNSLDLFVLPSYFEGFGCVFTEAAACGVPFMGCVGQGYSEYIPDEDRDKWLIEPGDSEALADKIYQYYRHRYRQALSKTFDIDILVKEYLKTIEGIN